MTSPMAAELKTDAVREALEGARQFITNGVELGFIRMPDPSTPDPAHGTLDKIEAALAALSLPSPQVVDDQGEIETIAKLIWEWNAPEHEVDWPPYDAAEYRSIAARIAARSPASGMEIGLGLPQVPASGASADGWVLAPLQPTDAMVEAGRIEGWDDPDHEASSLGHPWVREAVYEAMLAARPAAPVSSAAERDVLAERRRQVEAEGWTPEHDDQHEGGELADAAACYAATAAGAVWGETVPSMWPWARSWWKPRSAREDLVRAGALILAEIERLDRAALEGKANG